MYSNLIRTGEFYFLHPQDIIQLLSPDKMKPNESIANCRSNETMSQKRARRTNTSMNYRFIGGVGKAGIFTRAQLAAGIRVNN